MDKHFTSYQDELIKLLKSDRELSILYLKNALIDEDPRMLFIALKHVSLAYADETTAILLESIKQQDHSPNNSLAKDNSTELLSIHTTLPQFNLQLLISQEEITDYLGACAAR